MRKYFIFLLFFPFWLCADKVPYHDYLHVEPNAPEVEAPWFTGPLLAPSGQTIPPGHWNFEPYVYVVANTGHYGHDWKSTQIDTFWNNYFQPSIQVGINSWLDFSFNPTLFYNYNSKQGAAKWAFGDMPIAFDIQLYRYDGKVTDWIPAVKLTLKETLPLGKYQNLNPKKGGTDVGGLGSWQTSVVLVFGNLFYLGGTHFMTWRTALQYTLPAPVHVKNLNAYGGGRGTRGTVYPAQNVQIDTAIEVNLSRNWAFAMDFLGSWSGKTRFKGRATGPVKAPPSAQFSLAPALEYNWSAEIGLIFGAWFTIAGRNAPQFFDGVFAFNYYY